MSKKINDGKIMVKNKIEKIFVFCLIVLLLLPGVLALSEKEKAIQEKLVKIAEQEKEGSKIGFDFTGSLILFGGIFVAALIGFLIVKMKRRKRSLHGFGGAQGGTSAVGASAVREGNELRTRDEQIANYIRGAREAGMDDEEIRNNLASAGWKGERVDEGFRKA